MMVEGKQEKGATYQRLRIRFSKQGELRYIGHRDLVRTWERAFRRADLSLRMSQGFHPKAKMSFPLALAVGIAGTEEVMEVEFEGFMTAEEVAGRLVPQLPAGLELVHIEELSENARKARISRVTYELPIDGADQERVRQAIVRLRGQENHWIVREGRAEPLDLLADLETIELSEGVLRVVQRVTTMASAPPREILAALDLEDVDMALASLTRSCVELEPQ